MPMSYPSPAAVFVDIGEVTTFDADFHYNFFTTDEQTNDSGEVPDFLRLKKSESIDARYIDNVSRVTPRFIRLTFKPVKSNEYSKPPNEFLHQDSLSSFSRNFSIKKYYSSMMFEGDFTANDYINVEFYDSQIDNKLFTAVSGSVTRIANVQNRRRKKQIRAEISTLKKRASSAVGSLLDGARSLNDVTPDDINSEFIVKSLVRLDKLGASIVDEEKQKLRRRRKFDRIKNIKMNARVNSAVMGDVVRGIVNSPIGLLADDFAPHLKTAESLQARAIAGRDGGALRLSDYESAATPIMETELETDDFNGRFELVGYAIEKFEVTEAGQLHQMETIFVNDISVGSVLDTKVAYGSRYFYSIRTVSLVTLASTADDSEEITASTFMVASSPRTAVTNCIEEVPPPPPVDFNVIYDYQNRLPRLFWNFPVNTQQDIKQFQIFRRKTVKDPFMLLRVYNFDDSEIITPPAEDIFEFLVDEMKSPKTFYDDSEFTKESKFIYAVCCIDAHGYTSNLSAQFEISFDTYKNRLNKRLISRSGAPKAYPNLYLLEDTFVDVIKDSGHDRMTVYFDPEFLDVFNDDGENLGLLATDKRDGRYKVQFINTDLQQSQNLDIIINDLRMSEENN